MKLGCKVLVGEGWLVFCPSLVSLIFLALNILYKTCFAIGRLSES